MPKAKFTSQGRVDKDTLDLGFPDGLDSSSEISFHRFTNDDLLVGGVNDLLGGGAGNDTGGKIVTAQAFGGSLSPRCYHSRAI